MSTTATQTDYASYLEDFSLEALIARLDDHRDGQFNAYEACCGRHLREGRGEVAALVQEGLDGRVSRLSYAGESLNTEVVGWVERALGCPVMDHSRPA